MSSYDKRNNNISLKYKGMLNTYKALLKFKRAISINEYLSYIVVYLNVFHTMYILFMRKTLTHARTFYIILFSALVFLFHINISVFNISSIYTFHTQ